MHLRWSGCGGFEARFPSVGIAFDPYFFGEALAAAEPVYDYIFITHEHFDHCHPPTLERLCRGDRFRRLYVSPGCVHPARPVAEVYGDAAFERDLPITKSVPRDRVKVMYPIAKSSLIGANREFPANAGLDLHGIAVEVVESGENASPDVTDANAFVEWIRAQVGGRTTVLPFTAGVWYEIALPSLEVVWKWNWRRTWDVPPWRA